MKKISLNVQECPKRTCTTKKSQKKTWKQRLFSTLFKLIEAFWMLIQIAQWIVEIFRG